MTTKFDAVATCQSIQAGEACKEELLHDLRFYNLMPSYSRGVTRYGERLSLERDSFWLDRVEPDDEWPLLYSTAYCCYRIARAAKPKRWADDVMALLVKYGLITDKMTVTPEGLRLGNLLKAPT